MRGGFSFDGVDIDTLGLEYAPNIKDTYVFKPTNYSISEQKLDSAPGGYYYGATAQVKDFKLRCLFQDTNISDGLMSRVMALFRVGRTGRLVFQTRPWCYYAATVISVDPSDITNYLNGLITITLRAYYPFARSDQRWIATDDANSRDLMRNSAMMTKSNWTEVDLTSFSGNQTPIVVLNPGTEPAKVGIEIAGNLTDGVLIRNNTTGQDVHFHALNTTAGVYKDYTLYYDSLNGKAVLSNNVYNIDGYLYHDYGNLELAPGYPAIRNIRVKADKNSNEISSNGGQFSQDMVGMYIAMNDGSYTQKVVTVPSSKKLTVAVTPDAALNGQATMLTMNELMVTTLGNSSLTKLALHFSPTFA